MRIAIGVKFSPFHETNKRFGENQNFHANEYSIIANKKAMIKLLSVSLIIVSVFLGACGEKGKGELASRFNYLKSLKTDMNRGETEALFSSHTFWYAGNDQEMKYDLDESEFHQNIVVQYNSEGKSENLKITIDFSKHKDELASTFDQINNLFTTTYGEPTNASEGSVSFNAESMNVELEKKSDKIEISMN